jgi:hypothetical protein
LQIVRAIKLRLNLKPAIVNLKSISFLALWAVVAAASGDHDSFDESFADQAGL